MKRAFTLAEVLITLAIIGIIAVLTLPSLSNLYQKRVLTTQLQKSYAELSQAGAIAVATEMCGDFRKSKTLNDGEFAEKFIKNEGSASFAEEYGVYDCPNCKNYVMSDLLNGYDYDCGKLKSGASYCVNKNGDGFLDINSDKGPNQRGRDMYFIGFSADGTIGEYEHYLRSIIRSDWDIDRSSGNKGSMAEEKCTVKCKKGYVCKGDKCVKDGKKEKSS